MKPTALATIFGLIATAAAYPAANGLWARSCKPGTLVCNGNTQFGICNEDKKAVWMSVADGTECVCSGSTCTIVGSWSSNATASAPSTAGSSSSESGSGTGVENSPTPTMTAATIVPSSSLSPVVIVTPTAAVTGSSASAAASSSSTSSSSSSSASSSSSSGSGTGNGYIKTFLGDGEPSEGWPEQNQWIDFESMWSSNLENVISKSCTQFGQDNNSDQESADLKSAIQSVANSSGVDDRFILAIVMQESGGCVRAPTTNYGVVNPGLMQSHDGSHSCYNVNPCPLNEITGMIQDGTDGTSSGPGLKQDLAAADATDVSQYYKAARIYNSGSIASNGLLQDGIATHCYSSDVANRLLGWSEGLSGCSISS